jgi:dTDP-4-dehydrorhamnose reductase
LFIFPAVWSMVTFEADVDETAQCNPIGQYGIMKLMGEKLVEDYSRRRML